MDITYKGDTYHISDYDIYRNRDVYQFGWEFMRDGDLPTTDLHHHVQDCANAEIASAIIKVVAERFATDEEFRNTIINNVEDYENGEVSLSIQVTDDEEKPLAEATSKTSEDTHGGDEATKSIEGSPSAANEGKEDNENSSEAAGDDSKDEMSSDEEPSTGGVTHSASDILAAIENEPFDDHGAVKAAFDHVVRHIRGKAEGHRSRGWDGRKMVKHLLSKQLNRIPNDKKKTGVCKSVVVAVDCSGSCWAYLGIVKNALDELTKTHRVVIVDVSNGFSDDGDCTISDADPYENRKRLEEAFCNGSSIVMHNTITTPSIKTAASLAEQAEAMIIIADYDGYASIVESVQLIRNQHKLPWFIDLEERYDDPSDHNWNWDYENQTGWSEEDWPKAGRDRWLKLFPRGDCE